MRDPSVDRTAEAALVDESQNYAWDHAQKAENLRAQRAEIEEILIEARLAEMWATLAGVSQRAEMIATAREMDAKAAEAPRGWSSDLFQERHRLVDAPPMSIVTEEEPDPRPY